MNRPSAVSRRQRDLLAASGLLGPRLPRILAAVALGVLSLGSALALAGVSAWLITRAWQMPPVLDLSVAVVAVRAFAISRGVLHYCERLATHDTALRAAGRARTLIYHRLAHGPAAAAVGLHSGDLAARVGADVDELANMLVRALVPIAVAAVLAVAATAVVAAVSVPAAVVLAVCLLVAGVVAPWLAGRTAAAQEAIARQHRGMRDTSAMIALEHAPSFVSPVPYATSSPTHNGANMPGPMRSTPPHERGRSPRPCRPRRSGPACWAPWWPGSAWPPRSRPQHWPS
ncbi:cytochrome biosyntheisis ATP-bindingprotein/permease CydC [Mycobacterium tuberculosis variant bovis BCG]|nr:cytochrome biosyntheisis ATP-bindingprotein/permease CydC [Mycobacterium tuberculosis variant bovis BCG]